MSKPGKRTPPVFGTHHWLLLKHLGLGRGPIFSVVLPALRPVVASVITSVIASVVAPIAVISAAAVGAAIQGDHAPLTALLSVRT